MFALMSTLELGDIGERWVYEQLVKRGYKCQFMPLDCQNCDILITGQNGRRLPVEVKFARPTTRKGRKSTRWQFQIHETAQRMHGDWVLILVCQDSKRTHYPFIIPGQLVSERPHVQITSHPKTYTGWMERYLNRWDIIDYLLDQEYKNGGLPLEQSEAA